MEAKVTGQAADNTHIMLASIAGQGYMLMEQGQLRQAAEVYRQSLYQARQADGQSYPVASIAHLGLGELLYQWNELEEAVQHLEKGLTLGTQWGYVLFHARGYAILARAKQAQGDSASAMRVTFEAEEQGLQYDIPRVIVWAGATRAHLWLAQGKVEASAQWAQGAGLTVGASLNYLNEYEYMALARILIAQSRFGEALSLLSNLLDMTKAEGRTRSVVEVLVLQALTHYKRGNFPIAIKQLAQVLELAEPEGYARVFIDEGAAMVALLMRMVEARQKDEELAKYTFSLKYVGRLLEMLGVCVVIPTEDRLRRLVQPPTLLEPLSERELTVLQLIARGLSNQEIAEELIVALSTVKWHIKHIYGKLGVHSRTQVIVKARELGLLV
jgi:LuxR family maltose regulon positive regulatory protein